MKAIVKKSWAIITESESKDKFRHRKDEDRERTLHELGRVPSDFLERNAVAFDPLAVLAVTRDLALVAFRHESLT
jgi:hypothetical protein